MFALTEIKPPANVLEAEYQRLLGYPENRPMEGRARELAYAARQWFADHGRPWLWAHEAGAVDFPDGKLRIGGTEFSSASLRRLFFEARAQNAVLVAVSAGGECEAHARQLWDDGKPDEYFFLETFGSAVVEHLVARASGRICGWADENKMAALPHFSPGYSGWNIAEQIPLWKLFQKKFGGGFPGELEVLESGMLRPKKSMLTVLGLTRDLEKTRRFAGLIPCENCPLPDCRYRRAPCRRPRPRLETLE